MTSLYLEKYGKPPERQPLESEEQTIPTVTESMHAAWRLQRDENSYVSESITLDPVYEERINKITELTGRRMPEFLYHYPGGIGRWDRTQTLREFIRRGDVVFDENGEPKSGSVRADMMLRDPYKAMAFKAIKYMDDMVAQYPDEVLSDEQILSQVTARLETQREQLQSVLRRGSGTGAFLGAAGAAIVDPPVLMTLPFGAHYSVGRSVLANLARVAKVEGALGAGSEAVVQGQVAQFRKQIGNPLSWQEAAVNILTATVGSAAIGPAIAGSAMGISSLVRQYRSAVKVGKIQPTSESELAADNLEMLAEYERTRPEGSDPEIHVERINEAAALGDDGKMMPVIPDDKPPPLAEIPDSALTKAAAHGNNSIPLSTFTREEQDIFLSANTVRLGRSGEDAVHKAVISAEIERRAEAVQAGRDPNASESQILRDHPPVRAIAQNVINESKLAAAADQARETGIHDELRQSIESLKNEAGWAERGGRVIMNAEGEVTGRTPWLPKADWWPDRPGKYNPEETARIIDRGLAGERLGPKQQEYFDYLRDIATERSQLADTFPTPEELRAEGMDAIPRDADDVARVARAMEIDEDAVEKAAIQFADDETGFDAEIRRILDSTTETDAGRAAGTSEANQDLTNRAIKAGYPYEPARGISAEDRAIEERLIEYMIETPWEDLKAKYQTLEDTHDGKILSVDAAREFSPDYLADRTKSVAVHEPASAFIKRLYAERLTEAPADGELPLVIFMAGGTGAGKTSTLRANGRFTQAQIIYDSNLGNSAKGLKKFQQAIDAGKQVEVFYVHRDPVEALRNGAIPRAMRQLMEHGTGRTVPIDEGHLATHVGAPRAIREIAAKIEDNPDITITVIDNSRGKGKATEAGLDIVPEIDETILRTKLYEEIDNALAEGRLTPELAEGFRAKGAATSDDSVRSAELPESQRAGRGAPADGQGSADAVAPLSTVDNESPTVNRLKEAIKATGDDSLSDFDEITEQALRILEDNDVTIRVDDQEISAREYFKRQEIDEQALMEIENCVKARNVA